MEDPPPAEDLPAVDAAFDGGNLDCGNGLLLLIRRHIDPLPPGGLLEIRSTETSVEEDLPAWCRMTGNTLVAWRREGATRRFVVSKGPSRAAPRPADAARAGRRIPAVSPPAPLSVAGIGSWPRPPELVRALHERLEGRLSEEVFEMLARVAVRGAVDAQIRAGADLVTDGEQRRDNYASFVGSYLGNCQLIPLTDLLPLVDDPEKFERQMRALDVPADTVRHPAVLGRLARTRPLAGHELAFAREISDRPLKVALPGPYLLTRILWMDCIPNEAYRNREEIARDIVRILREEAESLLAEGAALVQFDEPVLTEVVHGGAARARTFMCGALSERGDAAPELKFAARLLQEAVGGLPRERLALHVCRGNWTPDESAALQGDYRPLLDYFREAPVGTLFLELCTPRAGEMEVLRALPERLRIGVGVVNPKDPRVESPGEIEARARRAVDLFGHDRVLLTPDCGFATFADNPVSTAAAAEAKLAAIVRAAERIRARS